MPRAVFVVGVDADFIRKFRKNVEAVARFVESAVARACAWRHGDFAIRRRQAPVLPIRGVKRDLVRAEIRDEDVPESVAHGMMHVGRFLAQRVGAFAGVAKKARRAADAAFRKGQDADAPAAIIGSEQIFAVRAKRNVAAVLAESLRRVQKIQAKARDICD